MILLLDNYDSFTYNLRDYIYQLNLGCVVVRNDEMTVDELKEINFSSAVISPGPKTPHEAGICMEFIASFYSSKPILGICLGHQALGEFFGAKLVKAKLPMHGKTSLIHCKPHYLFNGLRQQLEVMRYHSLVLEGIENTGLEVIAESGDKEIMAIAHPQFKIAGLQFHPESILTPSGLQMLSNWFKALE